MEIKHTDNRKTGSFYIEHEGNREAEMTYTHSEENVVTIDHTEVKASLKGQGIGKKLVDAAVAYLRENDLKAIAECSFVKSVFEKNQELYQDVIKN